MIGLVPYGLAKLFSLYLYAAHRHTDAAKVAVVSLIVTLSASLLLMQPMQAAGLALAGSLGGWTLFIFTVRKTGTTMFFSMLKHKYALYFIFVMLAAGGVFFAAAEYIGRFLN
jgi:putative peptidoglycan lipid II flippase